MGNNVKSKIEASLIADWLRDMGLNPTPLPPNGEAAWAFEVILLSGLKVAVLGPRRTPRAVVVQAMMLTSATQLDAFNNLDDESRKDFWCKLRSLLNREFVEFAIDGTPMVECPKSFAVFATRWDDGVTLDSFARSISSIQKSCLDGTAFFQEQLGGGAGPATGGEFGFRKMSLQ